MKSMRKYYEYLLESVAELENTRASYGYDPTQYEISLAIGRAMQLNIMGIITYDEYETAVNRLAKIKVLRGSDRGR